MLKLKIRYKTYTIQNYNIKTVEDKYYLISGYDLYGMYYQIKLKKSNIILKENQEDCLFIRAI